ncbi:hypothetical protein [uncultured Treponema sp.]|uniref:hypothetical protein n=1 Tax=uncultured Treponema sp. TaxID=162155 RepID=UPI0025F3858A|nr:hypothetical protein [uncultured Treponema sp.]
MRAKRNSIFITTICAVYILSLLVFIISLAAEYKQGAFNSQNRFNSITRDLSRISKNYAPQSKKFYDEFLASLGNISDIAGLQIKYGEELIFSYPGKMSEFEKINSSLVKIYSTTVFTENGIPLSLTASIYLLKPVSIFYKGRIAFIVVIIATLATAAYLAFFIKNGTFPKESETDDLEQTEYPEIESYDDFSEEKEEQADEEKINDENEETSENIPEQEEAPQEQEEDVLAFLNSEPEKETDSELENSEDKNEDPAEEEPAGLFCPSTGFGWEQYMLTRLDSELIRSASSDQDLSLFTVKIKDIDWNSECGKEISKTILEKVKFNDLVFNYKEDGASAIFQNQNTDKSLVIAGDLHTEITSVLSKYNEQHFVGIGISSRTLRLISATRLANESEEALNRADADSPIIAFRVNPERYKDFLASESFQEETTSSEQKEGNESTENKQEE